MMLPVQGCDEEGDDVSRSVEQVIDPLGHIDILRLRAYDERVFQQFARVRPIHRAIHTDVSSTSAARTLAI